MATRIGNITFDAHNPELLVEFWAAALGYEKQFAHERAAAAIDAQGNGTRLYFQKVPEPKTVKNRVHLDLNVPDMEATVERLVGLGARKVRIFNEDGETWTVMLDPEGNEFCVQPE